MPQTGKPLFNSPTLQDTFEKLGDQGGDVVQGLRDLATGDAGKADAKGDSGIEGLGGQKTDDPQKQLQQAHKQGLTPEQLAEKRKGEKEKIEFYKQQVQGWDEHYQQAMQEEKRRIRQAEGEKRRGKELEIIELQEEEAKNASLNPVKSKGPSGPGSAFISRQAKSSMGTGELSKTPTN